MHQHLACSGPRPTPRPALGHRSGAIGSRRALKLRAAAVTPDPGAHSTSTSSTPSTADGPWPLLRAFTAAEARGGASGAQRFLATAADRAALREALLTAYATPLPEAGWVPGASDVLLGVVASDARLAVRALRDWAAALGLEYRQPESQVPGVAGLAAVLGSVYVKYNSRGPVCYLSRYAGKDRGVLVQLGTQQLGHFPLGFFDEAKANPPPKLE